MALKQGKCINIGNGCNIADNKKIVEIPDGSDFICPDCGSDLIEVEQNKKRAISKPLMIGGVVFILLIGVGLAWFLWPDEQVNKDVSESSKKTQIQPIASKADDSTQTQSATNTPTANSESPEPKANSLPTHRTPSTNNDNQNSNTNQSTSNNSLQSNFNKLSDGSSYSAKDDLVAATLNLFTSRDAKVYTIGQNGTVVNDMSANDLLETMRTRNKHYIFIDGNLTDGKYSSIKVRAN